MKPAKAAEAAKEKHNYVDALNDVLLLTIKYFSCSVTQLQVVVI